MRAHVYTRTATIPKVNSHVCSFQFFIVDVNVKYMYILIDFSLTVKAATLIFISGCGSAVSSAKQGNSGFIYNLVKS